MSRALFVQGVHIIRQIFVDSPKSANLDAMP